MVPNYLILDVESTVSNCYGRKANALTSKLVAIGLCKDGESTAKYVYGQQFRYLDLDGIDVIVGHNLAYDLTFFWQQPWLDDFFKQGGTIWDTQLAENILTGQQYKYAALRDIAVNKYGCQPREKLMESYWDAGKCTSEIPEALVLKDVTQDVEDTEKVFLQQVDLCNKNNLLKLTLLQMDALCATIEMSYNGMAINQTTLAKNKVALERELDKTQQQLLKIVQEVWK